MPQAVTHILIPILIVALIRDIVKKKRGKTFSLHYVLLAGLAGVLPDIDIVVSFARWFIDPESWWIHKTITHSVFFPLAFLVLGLILLPFHKKVHVCLRGKHTLKLANICFVLAFGTAIHILLDTLFGSVSYLFYPFSSFNAGLDVLSGLPFDWSLLMALLDGVLLVIWIVYLELKHKISDFI